MVGESVSDDLNHLVVNGDIDTCSMQCNAMSAKHTHGFKYEHFSKRNIDFMRDCQCAIFILVYPYILTS